MQGIIFWRMILKTAKKQLALFFLAKLLRTLAIFAINGEVRIVVNKKNKLRSREERGGNVVSIEAYDNTSRAYKRETPRRPQTPFSIYLTLALWVFLLIFLFFLYEMAIETWERLK